MSQITQDLNLKPIQLPKIWVPLSFMLTTGIILGVMIFAMVGYQLLYFKRVYPGVQIADVQVGGMTPAEVVHAVNQQAPDYLARTITIEVEGEQWQFTGEELGLRVDAELTANKAYAIGRSYDTLADMVTQVSLFRTPQVIDPIILYDDSPTNQLLHQLANQLYIAPQDADITIYEDGQVDVTPSRWGKQLHIEATRPLIEQAIFSNDNRPVKLVLQQIMPNILEIDLEPARQQAETFIATPLTLQYETLEGIKQWSLEAKSMRNLLSLVETIDDNDKTRFSVALSEERVRVYLEQLAPAIVTEPINAELSFDVETSQIVFDPPSKAGQALDIETAQARIMDWINQPDQTIKLPIINQPAELSRQNLQTLGIKEVVSEATSYFYGSSFGRMNNIELSASKFNGLLIPPGETFSFNHYLGEVTAENGYDESLIIGGDRTTVGIGGGVCQVSTTVFRAALFGGYELVERWAHGYRVGWYETNAIPGLDATIYTPDVDFKFRNDTPYHILILTETDLEVGTITFRFFSTPTNREVILGDPEVTNEVEHGPALYEQDPSLAPGAIEQVDWAKDGMDVSISRLVKEGETTIHEDVIFSRYRPWRAVYKVGLAPQQTPSFNGQFVPYHTPTPPPVPTQ